jgi:Tol biopolymer transport system component
MSNELFTQQQSKPLEDSSRSNPPNTGEVRAELTKILNSDPFVRSQRIKRLLEFLVESVLAGHQDHLKETLVGIEVFDREPGYDSKQDPVVRVEMRRLRSKLSEYYLDEGKNDDVLIWLDKGSYQPALSWRAKYLSVPAVLEAASSTPELVIPAVTTVPETSVSPKERQRPGERKGHLPYLLLFIGASALLLAAAVLGVYFATRSKPPRELRVFPLAGNAGLETGPAFSPDSKQVAYSWDGNRRNFDIYVKSLEGGPVRRLTDNAAHDIDPAWSPDGREIAFLRVSEEKIEVVIIPSTSGVERVLGNLVTAVTHWQPEEPENNGAVGPVWSPDGTYLVVAGSKGSVAGLLKISMDGRQESLTSPPSGINDSTPRISTSGASTAFKRVWGAASSDLYVMPSRGGQPRRLTYTSRDIDGLVWLDDRNIIYSSNHAGNFRLWQIPSSGGNPRPVFVEGAQPQWPAISRDGRWMAFVEPAIYASIWRLRLPDPQEQVTQAEPFISSAGQDYSPTYSPDSKKIAFVSDRSGTPQIWISDSDGAGAAQVTNFKGSSLGSPQWSPDSRRLVFDGVLDSQSAIWLIDADGSDLRRLNNSKVREYLPTWSRDGRWVYFSTLRDGRDHLWKQNPDSGQSVELSNESFYDTRESPDRKTLYVQRFQGGIWRLPAEGGAATPIPELAGMKPARYWTLAEDTIYFVRQGEQIHTLESFNLVTRKFQKLAVIPAQLMIGTRGLTVSRRRDSILFVQRDQRRSSIMLQER